MIPLGGIFVPFVEKYCFVWFSLTWVGHDLETPWIFVWHWRFSHGLIATPSLPSYTPTLWSHPLITCRYGNITAHPPSKWPDPSRANNVNHDTHNMKSFESSRGRKQELPQRWWSNSRSLRNAFLFSSSRVTVTLMFKVQWYTLTNVKPVFRIKHLFPENKER